MLARLIDKARQIRAPKGLRARLLLALAFAIGPVLAIVIFQAAHSYREAVARSQDELLVSALTAGQSARSTLEKGRTVLNTLRKSRVGRRSRLSSSAACARPGQSAITRPPLTAPPTRKAQPPVP